MQNMYVLVKNGRTLVEIISAADLMCLVVIDMKNHTVGVTIEEAFANISNAIGKDTDNDFEAEYFLTPLHEIEYLFEGIRNTIMEDLEFSRMEGEIAIGKAKQQLKGRRTKW